MKIWSFRGSLLNFHQHQKDFVHAPNLSMWKSALGTGAIFSLMDSFTMHDEFPISSQWSMENTFFPTGMHGTPMSNQYFLLQLSLLQSFLKFLRSLQQCDDQHWNRNLWIDTE